MVVKSCVVCHEMVDMRGNRRMCVKCGERVCTVCGDKFQVTYKSRNQRCCTQLCANRDPEKKSKILETSIKNHGGIGFAGDQPHTWTTMTDEEKAEATRKREETCLILYGTRHPTTLPETKVKREATMYQRYGVTHNMAEGSPFREKMIERMRAVQESTQAKRNETYQNLPDEEKQRRAERLHTSYMEWFNNLTSDELDRLHEKQSNSAKRRFALESDETRDARSKAVSDTHTAKWAKYTPEERIAEIQRRHEAREKNGYSRVSKTTKLVAKRLNRYLNTDVVYEEFVQGYSYDLTLNGILIDINPTASHTSDLSFAHLIGTCDGEWACEKHPTQRTDYHVDRFLTAIMAQRNLITKFDDVSDRTVINLINSANADYCTHGHHVNETGVTLSTICDAGEVSARFHGDHVTITTYSGDAAALTVILRHNADITGNTSYTLTWNLDWGLPMLPNVASVTYSLDNIRPNVHIHDIRKGHIVNTRRDLAWKPKEVTVHHVGEIDIEVTL